ncbi:hypothetical protein ID866_5021 [Astraeus odoratus]|nr:hypothetical protein ID866_5021 [Astraeus odoratus]
MAQPPPDDSEAQRRVYQIAARLNAAMKIRCYGPYEKEWAKLAKSEVEEALKLAAEDKTVRHVPRLLIAARQALVLFPGTLGDIEPDAGEVEQDVWYWRRNCGRALTPPLDELPLGSNTWWKQPIIAVEDKFPEEAGSTSPLSEPNPIQLDVASNQNAQIEQRKRKLAQFAVVHAEHPRSMITADREKALEVVDLVQGSDKNVSSQELLVRDSLNEDKQVGHLRSSIREFKQSLEEERKARMVLESRLDNALERQDAIISGVCSAMSQFMYKWSDAVAGLLEDLAESKARLPDTHRSGE